MSLNKQILIIARYRYTIFNRMAANACAKKK